MIHLPNVTACGVNRLNLKLSDKAELVTYVVYRTTATPCMSLNLAKRLTLWQGFGSTLCFGL